MLNQLSLPTRSSIWRALLLSVLIAAAANVGCSPSAVPPAQAEKAPATSTSDEDAGEKKEKTVKLAIDFGDGTERVYDSLPWSEGVTVLTAMDKAKAEAEPVTYGLSGSGDAAFVNEINGVKNEGTGSGKKNWLFWVNGKFADRSAAVYKIQPADEVVWKFTVWPVE